jgi:predicted MPP superfamily phosphohydrolase
MLAHQPKSVFGAEPAGADLLIAGHTHGGQYIPWNYFVSLDQPYVHGLHKHGKMQVYVSRGTGYWGPPLRAGAPSEITVLRLLRQPV